MAVVWQTLMLLDFLTGNKQDKTIAVPAFMMNNQLASNQAMLSV